MTNPSAHHPIAPAGFPARLTAAEFHEHLPVPIQSLDAAGRLLAVNAAWTGLLGYGSEEVIGRPLTDFMTAASASSFDRSGWPKGARAESLRRLELTFVKRSGAEFAAAVASRALLEDRTHKIHTLDVLLAHDEKPRERGERQHTEKRVRDLQAELVHVSRLSAMGQMGAALAHELNQPLAAIINYVQASRRFLETGGPDSPARIAEVMEKAAQQATRAGQIIRRLRQFVEKGATEHHPDDINKVVEEATALALVGVQQIGIAVTLELAPELPAILIDRIQIQQVILNLVRNAVEAMAESPERALVIGTELDGDMVVVAVRDSGPGLAPDVARQLFQPFVTTKEKGMGIGLSICRSIIDAHGGRIWAAANPGGGMRFAFAIPAAPLGEAGDGG